MLMVAQPGQIIPVILLLPPTPKIYIFGDLGTSGVSQNCRPCVGRTNTTLSLNSWLKRRFPSSDARDHPHWGEWGFTQALMQKRMSSTTQWWEIVASFKP